MEETPKLFYNGRSCSEAPKLKIRRTFNDYPKDGNVNRSTAQTKAWVKTP